MNNDLALAVLAKTPIPGQVKTRMCPPCTFEEAAELARAFLLDVVEVLRSLDETPADIWCSYHGDPSPLAPTFGKDRLIAQRGADLRERIMHAVDDFFDIGYQKLIIIGADAPSIDRRYVQAAIAALQSADVVFGPSMDGGCVLVGLSCRAPQVFNTTMSTSSVFNVMQEVARNSRLETVVLPMRYDIDTVEDFMAALNAGQLSHSRNTREIAGRLELLTGLF